MHFSRVNEVGCSTNPNETQIKTVARKLTNDKVGFLMNKSYLIMDRDATFGKLFHACLRREGVKSLRLPPQIQNLNARLERFFGSLKFECLHKRILLGDTAMGKAVSAFLAHYQPCSLSR
ncbi:MAG: hypothetical protein OSA98_25660 [Rubripirellula sp.]|nr:hypothetical protein [Rubripirellula sp.]